MRIDQYLWCLRYYKSRNQASLACKQGHVRSGEQIVKPSREVLIGDRIKVRKNQIWHELLVMDIPKSRIGAKLVDIYRQNITPKNAFENAKIQYMLGDALYYGLFGLEENEAQASEWMINSADQGNAEAQLCLNGWYYLGLCGLEEDEPKALELLTKAAESGLAEAEKRLGDWYKEGIVVNEDHKTAASLYKKAWCRIYQE